VFAFTIISGVHYILVVGQRLRAIPHPAPHTSPTSGGV